MLQNMYESSEMAVRCDVGVKEFKVEVRMHQGLALSPFHQLFFGDGQADR